MKFDMKKPCDNCPFRTDVKFYLTPARAMEIARAITEQDQTFTCHKTIDYSKEEGERKSPENQHCAGAMIMLEKNDNPNQMMRIAERLNFYDREKLKMDSPVFDTAEEFIQAMIDNQNEDPSDLQEHLKKAQSKSESCVYCGDDFVHKVKCDKCGKLVCEDHWGFCCG